MLTIGLVLLCLLLNVHQQVEKAELSIVLISRCRVSKKSGKHNSDLIAKGLSISNKGHLGHGNESLDLRVNIGSITLHGRSKTGSGFNELHLVFSEVKIVENAGLFKFFE